MKRLQLTANTTVLYGIAALVAVGAFLSYRLGSLVGGLSIGEYRLWQLVQSDGVKLMDLLRDAVYLPHDLYLFVLQQLPFHGAGSLRFFGVVCAIMGILAFYYIIRRWYSVRVALISTTLFATSGWLLHNARLAGPEALYLCSLVLLALWACLLTGKYTRLVLPALCITAVLALYVPGAILLVVPALIWQRRNLGRAMRRVPPSQLMMTVAVSTILLIPLILTLAWPSNGTSLDQARMLAGIPTQLPTVSEYGANIVQTFETIFVRSDGNPLYYVGRLPLLDVFTSVMFAVGVYVFARSFSLDRSKFLLFGFVLLTLLVALGGIPLVILLPFVYLIAAEGISYLLNEWLEVFPRNPVARGLGVTIVTLAVLTTSLYHVRSYFVAWPNVPETKTTFNQKL